MIERTILKYLNEHSDIPFYMEEPRQRPKRYYLMEKTGASQNDRLFTAMLTIQSYGTTMEDAAELNDAAIGLMLNANVLPEVTRVRLNSDYNYTDTDTDRYRYQAVFNLTFYRKDY